MKRGLFQSPRNKRSAQAPLRAIVAIVPSPVFGGTFLERLSCGHEIVRKSNIFGGTSVKSRRCTFCPPTTKRDPESEL